MSEGGGSYEAVEVTSETPPEGRILAVPRGAVLLIVIDRPHKLNGFSLRMLRELAEAYTALDSDDVYRCGVLLANGKAFTAGLELDAVWPEMEAGRPLFPPGMVDPVSLRAPFRRKPLVCGVQGLCFTLGIELMLAADIVVAAEDCRFAQVEVSRGIMPIGGATLRMVERAGWGNAQRYLLTGDWFASSTAFRLGLVQEVVPVEDVRDRAIALAERITLQAPLAVRASLASSRCYASLGFAVAAEQLGSAQKELMATADGQEGKISFQQRRDGVFHGR